MGFRREGVGVAVNASGDEEGMGGSNSFCVRGLRCLTVFCSPPATEIASSRNTCFQDQLVKSEKHCVLVRWKLAEQIPIWACFGLPLGTLCAASSSPTHPVSPQGWGSTAARWILLYLSREAHRGRNCSIRFNSTLRRNRLAASLLRLTSTMFRFGFTHMVDAVTSA